MKVLHLTTHLDPGGITQYISQLVPLFSEMKIETIVVSSGGAWSDRLKERGAKLYEFSLRTKSIFHPKLYWAIPKLCRLIRENDIDVLHAHTRITQVVAFFLSKITGLPTITTCHGFFNPKLSRRFLPGWGDKVIAISRPVQDHLIRDLYCESSKVSLVSNGINIRELDEKIAAENREQNRLKLGLKNEDFVVGIVSRLIEDKGHGYLVRAISELNEAGGRYKALIVGDGKYREELKRLVSSLRIEGDCIFLGNSENVAAAYSMMDAFTLPVTLKEGFGLSIMEAMASRLPIIVTRVEALKSIIEDQNQGLVISPKSVTELAEAIKRLVFDTALRDRLSQSGRAFVESRYDIFHMAESISKLYHGLSRKP